jgi:DNA-binding NtrC family response regulator
MEHTKLNLNILLLDDDPSVLDDLGYTILEIGMSSSMKLEQPWRIKLGNEELEVFCQFIKDPDEAERVLRPGDDNKTLADIDVVLLDNDWESKQRPARFGLDILGANGWRRGWGPFLAIFTAARTFEPKFVSEALSLGADALIAKKEKTHLLNVLVAAVERKRARIELEKMRKMAGLLAECDPGLISASEPMRRTLQEAAFLAPWSKEPVLILGDVGTGKTRLARAIHDCSPRAKGPFVTLDPRQVADTLLQSELFGVERGAYTGAIPRKGVLELADGGTLFIDELQNMPKEMQEALLNIIEGRPFRKVGDPRERGIDVRFIFASNADPVELVNQGSLRKDFYSRIEMHTVRLPPLGERLEDVSSLAQGFINEFYADNLPGNPPAQLTERAVERLQRAEWPYNVRSLRNAIRRTLTRIPDKHVVDADDLIIEDILAEPSISKGDIRKILELAPRAGSQRVVFDRLLERMSEAVPYEELHRLIGEHETLADAASNNLTTIIYRLRSRLEPHGFGIVQDNVQKGYILMKVA